ncbi:MAG: helix-turn-helix transcriptional regulator [Terracidiphilus sp.]
MSVEKFSDAFYMRRLSRRLFGSGIRGARQRGDLSIQQAAGRADMDPVRWQAIESGVEVATRAEMPLLARGLGMSGADLAPLIILCRLICA